MKVYLDLVFMTNFIFDFIILITTSLILKRNVKIYKIILGSLIGSLSLVILFIRMNQIQLFIYKILISIVMILFTFNYKNIRYTVTNIYYLYLVSMILGGFLTLINNQLSDYNAGIIFVNKGVNTGILLSIILSIVLIISYINQTKYLKTNYNKYYKVNVYFSNCKITINGFLDTGNKLIDPYKKRPIILISEKILDNVNSNKFLLVPYHTVSGDGMLRCIKADKIYIENIGYKKKFLIGLTNNIKIDNVDCILNERLMEGL